MITNYELVNDSSATCEFSMLCSWRVYRNKDGVSQTFLKYFLYIIKEGPTWFIDYISDML